MRAALVRRAEDEDCLDEILAMDAQRRTAITDGDELRARRNAVSREIGQSRSQGGQPDEAIVARDARRRPAASACSKTSSATWTRASMTP